MRARDIHPISFDQSSKDKSKERDVENWKRVRTAIEHENTLVNQRLTWLFASQALLLSGFGLIFVAFLNVELAASVHIPPVSTYVPLVPYVSIILIVLAETGMYICLVVGVSLRAAFDQLCILTEWWNDTCKDKLSHPELHNFLAKKKPSLVSPERVPFIFFCAWGCLLVFSLLAVFPLDCARYILGLNPPTVAFAILMLSMLGMVAWLIGGGWKTVFQRHYSAKQPKRLIALLKDQ
jgi:hypothetical protein